MDTLSKKHRLRQQQLKRQLENNNKENFKLQYEDYDISDNDSTSIHSDNNYTSLSYEEQDDEEFRIFRVVELKQQDFGNRSSSDSSNKLLRPNSQRRIVANCKVAAEEGRDPDNLMCYGSSVDQSFVFSPSSNSSSPPTTFEVSAINLPGSTGSTRSNGDSSGFQSEGSQGTRGSCIARSSKTNRDYLHQSRPIKRYSGLRSKVIEDLDRLMGTANVAPSSSSPTESYISCADSSFRDTTLTRGNEFNYSTLCRDEFSSFIKIESSNITDNTQKEVESPKLNGEIQEERLPERNNGPVLVGVHEVQSKIHLRNPQTARYSSSPTPSDTSSEADIYQEIQAIESLDIGSSSESYSMDLELSRAQIDEQPFCSSIGSLSTREPNLGPSLDVYLRRVKSLLKLSLGEKNISLSDLFGDEPEIEVSNDLRTEICVKPLERNIPTKVEQKLEFVEILPDKDGKIIENRLVKTNSFEKDFNAIMSTCPQTTPDLNWNIQVLTSSQISDNMETEQSQLKEILADRFLSSYSKITDQFRQTDHLVKIVRRNIDVFLGKYNEYQSGLKAGTEFATGWRENWLFASKRPNTCEEYDAISAKRAKLSATRSHSSCNSDDQQKLVSEKQPVDLIKYSTLLMNKCKPVKLTYLIDETATSVGHLDEMYQQQEDQQVEMYALALEHSRQPDVCRFLVYDLDFEEVESNLENSKGRQKQKRPLEVSYHSSLVPLELFDSFRFSAYGYHFESTNAKLLKCCRPRAKSRELKVKILDRLRDLLLGNPGSRDAIDCLASERVYFSVSVTNVELINNLPVIQFCAKVNGPLPIRVCWFRNSEEVSDICRLRTRGQRAHLRFRQMQIDSDLSSRALDWPIGMHANYDYEYKTDWSSWFRFRRNQGDLVFEIRDANISLDYEQTYRCLVQNYCSQSECNFSLSKRQLEEVAKSSIVNRSQVKQNNNSRCEIKQPAAIETSARVPLVRTWSQRTLHKPPVSTRDPVDFSSRITDEDLKDQSKSLQQSVGRLSAATAVANEDKFGKSFPYHPENLLKRLEENKFSVTLKRRLESHSTIYGSSGDDHHQYGPTSGYGDQVTQIEFTESLELPAVVADRQQQLAREEHNSHMIEQPQIKQQVKAEQQVPAPRLSLKTPSVAINRQQADYGKRNGEHLSRSTGQQKSDLNGVPLWSQQQVADDSQTLLTLSGTKLKHCPAKLVDGGHRKQQLADEEQLKSIQFIGNSNKQLQTISANQEPDGKANQANVKFLISRFSAN